MANNATVTLTFKVQDDGTLKAVTGNINKAAKATDNLTASQKKATKASNDHNYTQNAGIIGAANSTRSFSKLAQTIGDGNSGLVGAYATLAANAFAVSAAFTALRDASQATLVLKGLEVQGARLGVTLTNTARDVQELARGSLSAAESMQAVAQASATGFNSDSIRELTTVAQNASIALGRNMSDSMDRLIKGTSKLEPELLDELGIMVKLEEATTKYALATGKSANSLTSFERRQAFLNSVLAEGTTKFGGLSDEVEADPYSKLAASFSNLTKDVLNFANSTLGVGSIVNFLADNSTALIGVLVMFAGTISRQLVPSLYQASEAAERAKNIIAKKIEVQKRQIAVTLQQAAAEKKASAASALSKVEVSGSPERVKKYIQALKEGNVAEGQREKALRSINGALGGNEAALKRMQDKESAAAVAKKTLIADLKAQKIALETLTTAELNHANVVSNSQNKLNMLRQQSIGLRMQTVAQTSRANAIELAGDFALGKSYKEGTRSIEAYRRGVNRAATAKLEAAANGNILSLSLARIGMVAASTKTLMFGLSVGVRALGAALLNAIPIIGQIIFAISLVIEYGGMFWNWMFPPPAGQEALDKAKESLGEILTRVDDTAKKTSAVFSDKGANVKATADAYLALSNTIVEVGEGLADVERAQKQLGVSSAKSAEKILSSAFEERGKSLSGDVVDSEAFKSLSSLAKLGFAPLNKEIENATINSKEFNEASNAEQIRIASDTVAKLTTKYAGVGMAIAELRTNYRDLDDATSNFIKAATPSTPYDNLVEKLTLTKVSINNLQAEFIKGTITAEDFNKQIAEVGTVSAGLLSAGTQSQIKSLQELNVAIKNNEEALANAPTVYVEETRRLEQDILELKLKQGKAQKLLADSVATDLSNQQQKMLSLQRQQILIEAQTKLETARFNSIRKYLSDTGLGYQVIIDHEEKMRGMQVSKIKAEQAVLSLLNLQNNIRLESSKEEKRLLDIRIANIKAGKEDLGIINQIVDKFRVLGEMLGLGEFTTNIEDLDAQAKVLEGTITSLEAEASKMGAAIQAMDISVAAILAENLTDAEIAAEKLSIDFENIKKLADKIKSSTADINGYEEKRLAVLNDSYTVTMAESRAVLQRSKVAEIASREAEADAINKLNIDVAALKASRDRAGAETQAGKAVQLSLDLKEQEIKLTKESAQIQRDIIRNLAIIELAEKYKIDTMTNGLEIQQNSINLLQKEADLKSNLIDQEKELALARARLLARGTTGDLSPEVVRAIEAKAAAEQYTLAKEQFGLKMAAIDAEYALLEAQKLQLEFSLKAQYAFLEKQYQDSNGIDAKEQTALNQVSSAIENISRIDYTNLKGIAVTAEKNTLELLRLRALEANSPIGGAFSGLSGGILQGAIAFNKFSEASMEMKKASTSTKDATDEVSKVVLPNFSEATIKAEEALSQFNKAIADINLSMPELKTKLSDIATDFNGFLQNLKNTGGLAPQTVSSGMISGGSAAEMAKSMFDYAKANYPGLRVDEFGVKSGHGKDSLHYSSRAFDVNVGKGSTEANNPQEKAQLDALAKDLSSRGVEVLWNGFIYGANGALSKIKRGDDQHLDHLHAEIDDAAYNRMKKGVQMVDTALTSGTVRGIQESTNTATTSVGNAVDARLTTSTASSLAAPITRPDETDPVSDIVVKTNKAKISLQAFTSLTKATLAPMIDSLRSLGPDGEVLAVALEGMTMFSENINATFKTMSMTAADWEAATGKVMSETSMKLVGVSAVLSAIGSGMGIVSQILKSDSDAKIARIDKEIAAEEKRDGKSAGSVEKINAMSKKKDDIARKSFNVQKKLQLAQAVVNTAAGITMALGTLPPPYSFIMAGISAAMGAAQIGIIASTSYESASTAKSVSMPSNLSIGKRSDTVDLARGPNANAGGESGYLRGAQGTGTNASNYRTTGSAYGGELMRGYGNRGFVVGEKGPEVITPETPISVTPADSVGTSQPVNATFNIHAIDSQGVQDVLVAQKGNIIKMLRDTANASGKSFMEDVNVNVYTRPSVGKL